LFGSGFIISGRRRKIVISASVVEKIEKFAESNYMIVAAYVFGSSAAGKERPKNDIDVAIMIRGSMGGFERVRMETELSNVLGKDIDLVVFSRVSPLFQHQILKYGRIVYEADARERIRQEVMSRRDYLDSLALYRLLGKDKPDGG
jgi:uncharacterized protein